jgi:hypothetical protein
MTIDVGRREEPEMRRCIAAVALVLLVAASCSSKDDHVVASTTTSSAPTTTSTTAFGGVDRSTAVWPSSSDTQRFSDPVDAARAFAVDFLHFTEPVVGAYQAGDSRSGEIEVRPRADGPVTTILLRRLAGEETWSVLGAGTAETEITSPSAGEAISSPLRAQGRALAFEGNVNVEVRQDGALEPIGTGYVTGGGDVMRPFDNAIAFDEPTAPFGAVVFVTRSMEDSRVWTASVVRVRFGHGATTACTEPAAPSVGSGQMLVSVFFTCDDGTLETLVRVQRAVPASSAVLRAALTALVAGPGDTGLVSWFSKETAAMVRSVDIDGDHAVVDFHDVRSVIPNASTSAGSKLLLDQLDATVFQFASIESVEYRIDGSCDVFSEWLQLACADHTRH